MKIALGACGLVNAVALVIAAFNRHLWRRRTPAAQMEAERWEAFRRYLTDFPRSISRRRRRWTLGDAARVRDRVRVAERVLQGAQLHMPEALAHASTLYWIGPYGDLGSGPTSMSIGDLAAGFGSALAPPSSGSGGFGGGSSGGGGGGAAVEAAAPGKARECQTVPARL